MPKGFFSGCVFGVQLYPFIPSGQVFCVSVTLVDVVTVVTDVDCVCVVSVVEVNLVCVEVVEALGKSQSFCQNSAVFPAARVVCATFIVYITQSVGTCAGMTRKYSHSYVSEQYVAHKTVSAGSSRTYVAITLGSAEWSSPGSTLLRLL
jgi:hypothetical protein